MGVPVFLTAKRPSSVGVIGGQLQPRDPGDVMTRAMAVLMQTKNGGIAVNRPNDIDAEFVSQSLGFVDDVEFLQAMPEQLIYLRSAACLARRFLGQQRCDSHSVSRL